MWKELDKENKDFFRAYFIRKSAIYSGTTTRSIDEARTKIEALNMRCVSECNFHVQDDEFNVRQACKSTLQQILPLLDVEHMALLVNRRDFNSDHRSLGYSPSGSDQLEGEQADERITSDLDKKITNKTVSASTFAIEKHSVW
eukprot:Gb_13647 [translate_table: standard]